MDNYLVTFGVVTAIYVAGYRAGSRALFAGIGDRVREALTRTSTDKGD